MNYSELLQLAKGWSNLVSNRIIIWRLQSITEILTELQNEVEQFDKADKYIYENKQQSKQGRQD